MYSLPPFFFLSLRRPPRSPLFPYTTLFRSIGSFHASADSSSATIHPEYPISPWSTESVACMAQTPDRKSTRLNSSHTVISYAVFCLKKKKVDFHQHLRRHHEGLRDRQRDRT